MNCWTLPWICKEIQPTWIVTSFLQARIPSNHQGFGSTLRLKFCVVRYPTFNMTWCRILREESARWWFQIFSIFTPIWGNDPIWLIFFKGDSSWWFQPIWKTLVQIGSSSPSRGEKRTCLSYHQPDILRTVILGVIYPKFRVAFPFLLLRSAIEGGGKFLKSPFCCDMWIWHSTSGQNQHTFIHI